MTKTKNKHQREAASPSPSEGGDVRGYGGIWWLAKPRVTVSPSLSEGGDVPDGIQNAGGWGDGRRKN